MRKIDISQVKLIQLSILDDIHSFCKENGIKYSLACGTMLGCARHKGYIPWDDDIDIYLLRDDYNKLINIFPEIYNQRIRIISLERDKHWNRAYAKAFDNRTIFSEKSECSQPIGINIDIFPIDKIPENEKKWISYNRKRRLLQKIYALKIIAFSKNRNIAKNLFLALSKIILSPFSSRFLAICLQRYCIKYNKTKSAYVFENALGMLLKKPFPISLFNALTEMPFENRKYMCMRDFDSYLTSAYGNWRQLPPIEKRVSHHSFNAYWKDLNTL